MPQKYDLRCNFDLKKHKETFVNYLEVIITSDGVVHYAVPSHQEYMIMLAMLKNHWTRQDLQAAAKEEIHEDFMIWLSKITESISVWNNFIVFYRINEAQYKTLSELKSAGIFQGLLPPGPMTLEEYTEYKYGQSDGTTQIW